MDALTQIKKLAPFLDPHLLMFLLEENVGEESQVLQSKIKAKLASADQTKAADMIQAAEQNASKMKTLLSESQNVQKMRKDGTFNFESLSRSSHKITIEDCEDYFRYCKTLFECQKYDSKFLTQLSKH